VPDAPAADAAPAVARPGGIGPGPRIMKDMLARKPRSRRDRLKQLQAFCEVVRLGSVSAAAKELDSSQPAVSNHVRTFEDEIGTPLFLRRAGRMVPTGISRHVYRAARPLVIGLHRLPLIFEDYHRGDMSEALQVGVGEISTGFVLPPVLRRFRERFPHTRIELRAGSGRDRLKWLRNFDLDVIVAAFAVVPDDIEFYPLAEANAVLITPEGHPLGDHESVSFQELSGYPMVVPGARSYVREILEVVLALHGLRLDVAVEADGWGTMISHVAAGTGIAIVPDLCVADSDPLCKVGIRHSYQFRRYGIAVRSDKLMGLTANRFLEIAGARADGGGATDEA